MMQFSVTLKEYAGDPFTVLLESKDVLSLLQRIRIVYLDLFGEQPDFFLIKSLPWFQLDHQLREKYPYVKVKNTKQGTMKVCGMDVILCDGIVDDITVGWAPTADNAARLYTEVYRRGKK